MMGVMKEQKEERERKGEGKQARDSCCGAAFDVLAGLELNAEPTEG